MRYKDIYTLCPHLTHPMLLYRDPHQFSNLSLFSFWQTCQHIYFSLFSLWWLSKPFANAHESIYWLSSFLFNQNGIHFWLAVPCTKHFYHRHRMALFFFLCLYHLVVRKWPCSCRNEFNSMYYMESGQLVYVIYLWLLVLLMLNPKCTTSILQWISTDPLWFHDLVDSTKPSTCGHMLTWIQSFCLYQGTLAW